jgi:hypothetical protein
LPLDFVNLLLTFRPNSTANAPPRSFAKAAFWHGAVNRAFAGNRNRFLVCIVGGDGHRVENTTVKP